MMRMRSRRAAIAVVALLAAALPFLAGVQPADAAVNQDIKFPSLTFVTYDGNAVTCKLRVAGYHDPDAHNAEVVIYASSGSGTDSFDACFRNVSFDVTMTYKDENGTTHSVRGRAMDYLVVDANHAASAVKAVLSADFSASCDAAASATCVLPSTVSPK